MNPEDIEPLWLSLRVALVATALVAAFGITVAALLRHRRGRGAEILDVLTTLPLVLPPTVTGYFLLLLVGRNGLVGAPIYRLTGWTILFTWQAAVLAAFVVALPLMIKTARAALESVDQECVKASYTLGHSEFFTFIRVILPLARKGIVAGIVLSFARALGEFGATLMLAGSIPGRTETVPIAIYSHAASGDWEKAHMLALLFTIVSGASLYMVNRLERGTV